MAGLYKTVLNLFASSWWLAYHGYMGRRTAFMLASIHEGTSVRLWHRALSCVDLTKDALIAFPGGRLDFKGADEYLRNSIYSLICPENIDGLVAWASTLAGDASTEDVCSFMRRFDGLPIVTIGLKTGPDVPLVDFDAYQGFFSLVTHLVKVHGKKRICMLRGPEYHASSQRRYQAYLDALASCGIPFDPDLVSSPHPWGRGREALDEIMSARGLVPSLDFDALVCASDMMMYAAVRRLEELGVNIPGSLAVCGFNDSETNKLLATPPTTVRMPAGAMMACAMSRLKDLMEGRAVADDTVLDASLVVRRSCGCHDSFGGEADARAVIKDESSFTRWAVEYSGGRLREVDLDYLVGYALRNPDPGPREQETFLSRFAVLCRSFIQQEGESEDLVEIAHWFSLLLPLGDGMRDFCLKNLDRVILRSSVLASGEAEYRFLSELQGMNSFKMALLSTKGMDYLGAVMKEHLPGLGFRQAYLVLFNGDEGRTLVAGYDPGLGEVGKEDFSAPYMLPERYRGFVSHGAFVVEPVIRDREAVGYLVIEVTPMHKETTIEDVMASVSSALKGMTLLEEANSAKDKAEEAEREAKEFYANVSEDLREPLSAMRQALSGLPSEVKGDIYNNVSKAEHLLDLILSERGELEVAYGITDPSSFLRAFAKEQGLDDAAIPDGLPVVLTDPGRLSQALAILVQLAREDGDGPRLSACFYPNGLGLGLSLDTWHPAMLSKNPSLQLAERIVMLLSGTFHFKEHSIQVMLPWPTLSGGMAPTTSYGPTLFIRHSQDVPVPACLAGCPQLVMAYDSDLASSFNLPEGLTQLAYDASEPHRGAVGNVVLNLLRNHESTKDLAFICLGLDSLGTDFWSALSAHNALYGRSSARILVLGGLPDGLGRLSSFGRIETFDSPSGLFAAIEPAPALVILREGDAEMVEGIRALKAGSRVPVVLVRDEITSDIVDRIADWPGILLVNTCICRSDEFFSRLVGIFGGGQVLAPLTGALVKKVCLYINRKARGRVIRWQVADSVNISEDYMTRIFKRELGISPWDYLNRYRVQIACSLLRGSGRSVNEVAHESGFQDQAYFCRVFKRIMGVAPGKLRM